MIDPQFAQWIVGQGVAVGVLMWFMLRMEKRMEDMTDAIKDLCKEVTRA